MPGLPSWANASPLQVCEGVIHMATSGWNLGRPAGFRTEAADSRHGGNRAIRSRRSGPQARI